MTRGGADPTTEAHATRRSIRIGLTGPIGCGKTTVAGWLSARGAAVIDADAIAREVTKPGEPALDAVFARFGPSVRRADGTLDRAALGRIVFSDPSALRDLEAIVHPAVRPRIERAVADAEALGAPIIVVEAIKLVEAGYAAECDEVWLVVCNPEEQKHRLIARGGDPDEAAQRVAAQPGLADRLRPAATRVIDTSGSPKDAEAAVEAALAAALAGSASARAAS